MIGLAFGHSMLSSIRDLASGRTVGEGGGAVTFGDSHMYGLVVFQLILFPVLFTVLYAGGWRLRDLHIRASVPGTIMGAVIFAGMWLGNWIFSALMEVVFPSLRSVNEMWEAYRPADAPTLVSITLVSLVNPVFEELFVCGYVIEALRRRFGTTTAVNVSVVIRAVYHLYQGIAVQPFHIAYGLVQAYVYVRYGRLWPLFVSHALLDFVALAFYL